MGATTPPPPAAPAPPAVPTPAAPPAGLVIARWMYVDEHHTHEVHAGVRPGAVPTFVVKEGAFQHGGADEIVTTERAIESPWDMQLYHWQLECRLAALGKYWRHDTTQPGWRALVAPQGLPQLDLREVAISPYHGRVTFHHFHHRKLRKDKLLVMIPNATPQGKRFLLALGSFVFPNGADADLSLLHAQLPEAPARSLIVREHLELKEKGYDKLVWGADLLHAYGPAWARESGQVYGDILRRVSEGRFGAVNGQRDAVLDTVYTDFLSALTDPRLLELQSRYLTAEEQEKALTGGEPAIRRLIALKREHVPHDEQHKLTVVEASLLARDQLRPGQRARVDTEVSALVRRFSYYL